MPKDERQSTAYLPGESALDPFAGGPLFRLLLRARLIDSGLHRVGLRIAFTAALIWLPLLVLSIIEGHFLGGHTAIPFARDIECHVRFLVVVPLLIAAEPFVSQRLITWVAQFHERELIPEDSMARFDRSLVSARRLRDSALAEAVLLAIVYGFGILVVWRQFVALDASSWYSIPSAAGGKLSMAGFWYAGVSLPLFQFLLGRWYWRLFISARFLWDVSRIPLRLVPTHPDRMGGLGFLAGALKAYVPLALAHGALVSGQLANRILFAGGKLPQFIIEIATVVVALLAVLTGPLWVFAPQLAAAKRVGIREYGALAQRYMRAFDDKWIKGPAPADEPLIGSADIQSLADMGNSFGVIEEMRISPVSRGAILQLAAAFLAPIVPLALTMMPAEKLIQSLIGLVL